MAGPPHNDDNASDVSMAEDSADEDFYGQSTPTPQADENATTSAMPQPAASGDVGQSLSSRKRKTSEDGGQDQETDKSSVAVNGTGPGHNKKVKLDGTSGDSTPSVQPGLPSDRSLLSAGVWHHIFTFCPPKTLGSLMSVNKLFHSWLDPSSQTSPTIQEAVPASGIARQLKPNSIWKASRCLFWPNMPAPLRSKTELDMWKLACSLACEHCGKSGKRYDFDAPDPTATGPGMDGVAIVWPFATCICGPCLLKKSVKEIDILLSSSTPSALLPAIPFVLLTDKLHVVTPQMIERGQTTRNLDLTKLFWQAGVDLVKQEFFSVKEMGQATAEEWLKGLEGRGSELQQDYSKWEKFASAGGVAKMRKTLYPGYEPQKVEQVVPQTGAAPAVPPSTGVPLTGIASLPRAPGAIRQQRTLEEVAALRAARRAEIERRAMLLDPPIPPSLLEHMTNFQASMQLTMPLNDAAWEHLKPKLIQQRADAEQRVKELDLQSAAKQAREEQHTGRTALGENKEAVDNEWDTVQGPLRGQIAGYADDYIRKHWDDGDGVTKDTCGTFAANVLMHVRKQFYAEIAKEAAEARAAGKQPVVDLPGRPYTRKLTLENMKWIFDTKIRPHTEPLRKEIFLCHGCEQKIKFYGFEGVVQHYAAKHTSALSSGSIVVHWRAEWPEVPPFHPAPRSVKIGQHQHVQAPFAFGQYPTNGPPLGLPAPPPPHQQPPMSYPPYGAPPQFPEPYAAPPPAGYQQQPVGYGAPPPQPMMPGGYGVPPYQGPPGPYQPYAGPADAGAYQQPPMAATPVPAPPTATQPYGAPVGSGPPMANTGHAPPPGPYNYNHGAYEYPSAPPPTQHFPDRYGAQLEQLARNARDLWALTANIKDLPGSARLHVVIHHATKRFLAAFSELAPLTMFIDGLSNHKEMRPVRNVNGLMCKTCQLSGENALPGFNGERKSFSLPQLAYHFQSAHIERAANSGQHVPIPDWTTGMILLPDLSGLSNLRMSVSNDSQKHHLFSEALPQLFQAPAATAHLAAASTPGFQQGAAAAAHWHAAKPQEPDYPPPSVDNHERFYNAGPAHGGNGSGSHVPPANSASEGAHKSQNGWGDAGRAAPHGNQHKSQTPVHDGKNKKKKSGPKGRNANGSRKDDGNSGNRNGRRGKGAETNDAEAKLAEEQERKQEEEIRAMWAADRAQTARQQTTTATAQKSLTAQVKIEEPPTSPPAPIAPPSAGAQRRPKSPGQSFSRTTAQHPGHPAHSSHQPPSRPDREGSDPLRALEMHLEQEYRSAAPVREPQDYYQRVDRAGPVRVDEGRRRSRSPVYVSYVEPQLPARYRDRSPPPQASSYSDAAYHRLHAPEDALFERGAYPPASEYRRVYADDRRPLHSARPVEYVEYELVRGQDEHGEFIYRVPVVRREPRRSVEPEQRYYAAGGAYETDRQRWQPEPAYLPPYEQRTVPTASSYARQSVHPEHPQFTDGRGESRAEASSATAAPGPPRPRNNAPVSREDPAYFEEYDPRYPAASMVPRSDVAARPPRYQ